VAAAAAGGLAGAAAGALPGGVGAAGGFCAASAAENNIVDVKTAQDRIMGECGSGGKRGPDFARRANIRF
jgi:hypothetical protein